MKRQAYNPRRKKMPVIITREDIEKAMEVFTREITYLKHNEPDNTHHPMRPRKGS